MSILYQAVVGRVMAVKVVSGPGLALVSLLLQEWKDAWVHGTQKGSYCTNILDISVALSSWRAGEQGHRLQGTQTEGAQIWEGHCSHSQGGGKPADSHRWGVPSAATSHLASTLPLLRSRPHEPVASSHWYLPPLTSRCIPSSGSASNYANTSIRQEPPPYQQISAPLCVVFLRVTCLVLFFIILYNSGMKCGIIATKHPPY